MSKINTVAPDWSGIAFHNDSFVDVSSEDYRDKWAVMFFYPADFSYVCPTELEDLADNYAQLQRMGVEVYSVSTDKHPTPRHLAKLLQRIHLRRYCAFAHLPR